MKEQAAETLRFAIMLGITQGSIKTMCYMGDGIPEVIAQEVYAAIVDPSVKWALAEVASDD